MFVHRFPTGDIKTVTGNVGKWFITFTVKKERSGESATVQHSSKCLTAVGKDPGLRSLITNSGNPYLKHPQDLRRSDQYQQGKNPVVEMGSPLR
jgi:hypothetical protein